MRGSDALTEDAPAEASRVSTGVPEDAHSGPRLANPPKVSHGFDHGAIIDRYTVLERLGGGGMGEVYAAYDRKLDRKVALKLLVKRGEEYDARLAREAQAMARLSHPNVVAVYDTGAADEQRFLVMEFVKGETLHAWQSGASRSWSKVLGVYLDAGRGLLAAHRAGLVHRDFKPDNVLLSEQGNVKVMDFGIARASNDVPVVNPAPATNSSLATSSFATTGSPLETPLTREGAVMGTPGYMAPEQYLGEMVDARTDQFSFCVALFEGLYRCKPFFGKDTYTIANSTIEGRFAELPKSSAVPLRIHRVLMRGLRPEASARYPSMQELLDDLMRDPSRQRRRIVAGILGAGAIAATAIWSSRVARARQMDLCSGAELEAREVWNPDVQNRVQRALLGTGVPYAADAWQHTHAGIDTYVNRWSAMHRQTCEATRVHKDQSEQVMTVRMACLEQSRARVQALTQVLAVADTGVASRAVQATMDLPDIDACKNVTSLMTMEPAPTDPDKLAELDAIAKGFATGQAMLDAGKFASARAQAEALLPRARTLGYRPLLAKVLHLGDEAGYFSNVPHATVLNEAAEAVFVADAGRDDETRARSAIGAFFILTDDGRYPEAIPWSKIAEASLDRLGDSGALRSEWLIAVAWGLHHHADSNDAVAWGLRALEACRGAGSNPKQLARIERALATFTADLGRNEEARRYITEADDIVRQTLGEEHPERVTTLFTRAYVAENAGDPRAAVDAYKELWALAQRVAPDSVNLAESYSNACGQALEFDDIAVALSYCDKARAISESHGRHDSLEMVYILGNTGSALAQLHRYGEARSDYEEAIRIAEKNDTQHLAVYESSLLGVADALLRTGNAREAVAQYDRALAVDMKEEPSVDRQKAGADIRLGLAQALWATGDRSKRVGELAHASAELQRRLGKEDNAREAEKWRAEHPAH